MSKDIEQGTQRLSVGFPVVSLGQFALYDRKAFLLQGSLPLSHAAALFYAPEL